MDTQMDTNMNEFDAAYRNFLVDFEDEFGTDYETTELYDVLKEMDLKNVDRNEAWDQVERYFQGDYIKQRDSITEDQIKVLFFKNFYGIEDNLATENERLQEENHRLQEENHRLHQENRTLKDEFQQYKTVTRMDCNRRNN